MMDQTIFTPFFLDIRFTDLDDLPQADWIVNDPELPPGEKQPRMIALYEPLAEHVATAVRAGKRPVSVAGDCCAAIGMLAGLQRAGVDPNLIWFDAHGDFNTWETTPSGFLGGMPLAMIVGRGEQMMPEGVSLKTLPEWRVTLTDGRDLDALETEAVAESAVNHLALVTDLAHTPLPEGPLWIHFDADVVNPLEAPAMSYPAEGGPSTSVLGEVFQYLASSGQVAGVSVSLWNPQLDADGSTRKAVLNLLQLLLD